MKYVASADENETKWLLDLRSLIAERRKLLEVTHRERSIVNPLNDSSDAGPTMVIKKEDGVRLEFFTLIIFHG